MFQGLNQLPSIFEKAVEGKGETDDDDDIVGGDKSMMMNTCIYSILLMSKG